MGKPHCFVPLEEEFTEDEEIQFGQPDDEAPELSVWGALPVHKKVAALFMPGLDMQKSLQLYGKLYMAVGEENYHLLDGCVCSFGHRQLSPTTWRARPWTKSGFDLTPIHMRKFLGGRSNCLTSMLLLLDGLR